MAAEQMITETLAGWIGRQRWFTGKENAPVLRCVAAVTLQSTPLVEVKMLLISDRSDTKEVLYQVPVVARRIPCDAREGALIGVIRDDRGGEWHLYDGPEDPAFTARLAQLIAHDESCGNVSPDQSLAIVQGVSATEWPHSPGTSRVLRGEQSNTSIVFEPESGADGAAIPSVICKIFRMLHDGENPDVVLQSALFAAGSRSVPPIFGSVTAEWPDASGRGGIARGHLVFAQQFLSDATDAWGLALAAASSLTDFTASARLMGMATADIHDTLATALPTRAATATDIGAIIAAWRARLAAAITEVPELAAVRPSVELLYERAASVRWPPLQSIHGDLHLGQILASHGDSWVIIDFEGEPMRPLAERSQPDLPLRDVAGMLRSFDYAAGSQSSTPDVAAWAHACRAAFIDGYIAGSGRDIRKNQVLLDAFELDKALYEVVYEAHNRPAWLSIPTDAVRRIIDRTNVLAASERLS